MKPAPSDTTPRRQRRTATNVAVRQERLLRWLEESREAIVAYNARVDDRGVFSDAWRKF